MTYRCVLLTLFAATAYAEPGPIVGLGVASSVKSHATWTSGDFGSPVTITIDARTLVYFAARKKDGPMCIGVADAPSPTGPFEDHGPITCAQKNVPFGAIDPFVIADGGTRWLVWKEDGSVQRKATPLLFQELRKDGLRLLDDARELLQNDAKWEGKSVSAPSLIRRGDWIYTFYAAGDACTAIGVARAPMIKGPWVKAPKNPLVDSQGSVRCPNRPMVRTTAANTVQLAYHLGDDMRVVDVTFGKDGWPVVTAK